MLLALAASSSKKTNRGHPSRFRFEIRVLEIKPWLGSSSHPSKLSSSLILRWQRGDRHSGATKSVVPQPETRSGYGKIVFNESFMLPGTLYRKTGYGNAAAFQEKSIDFSLLDANNIRGQPLARASLDLAIYAAPEQPKSASIPLIVSRHVPAGGMIPNLLLIVESHESNRDCLAMVKRHKISGAKFLPTQFARVITNRAFSPGDLGGRKHDQKLAVPVALSEEDEEIASFTDDDSNSEGFASPLDDVDTEVASPVEENKEVRQLPVAGDGNYNGMRSTAQPSPSKSATVAAASIPKRFSPPSDKAHTSFIGSSSEASSPGDDAFFTPLRGGGSPARHTVSHITGPPLVSDCAQSNLGKHASNQNDYGNPSCTDRTVGGQIKPPLSADRKLPLVSDIDALQASVAHKHDEILAKRVIDTDRKLENASKHSQPHADVARGESKPEFENATVDSGLTLTLFRDERTTESKTRGMLGTKDEAEARKKQIGKVNLSVMRDQLAQANDTKIWRLSSDDMDSEYLDEGDREPKLAEELSVLEEARLKFAKGADKRNEKMEKRALEEAKLKVAEAEAKSAAASEKMNQLQLYLESLKWELQDVAALEAILFGTVAEHDDQPQKVLTPARHLARLFKHVTPQWSVQRRASFMRNTISGLIVVTKACGQDIARLMFWWSNVLALRHAVILACKVLSELPSSASAGDTTKTTRDDIKKPAVKDSSRPTSTDQNFSLGGAALDWKEPTTFIVALERVEAWAYARVVESVWWQALAPHMQKHVDSNLHQTIVLGKRDEENGTHSKTEKHTASPFDFEDRMQQNISIDIWKQAFLDALRKLCPIRARGGLCGCIPGLTRLIMEECVTRLDISMFNSIMHSCKSNVSDDPISDAIFDSHVLPIPPGHLSFGSGAELKNVVGTWSTWLTNILQNNSNNGTGATVIDDEDTQFITFPLLKAVADLLMLPRDMIADKSVRKEICPALTLPVIRKILLSIEPDEFSPDPVTPSLLAAVNAEISLEKQMYGDKKSNFTLNGVALVPAATYLPQSSTTRDLIQNEVAQTVSDWSNSTPLRGGLSNEVDQLKTLFLSSVQECNEVTSGTSKHVNFSSVPAAHFDSIHAVKESIDYPGLIHRFDLLQELWSTTSKG